MASTTFSSGTTITSTWLNDVDAVVWDVFNGATTVAGATARLNSFVGDSGSGGTKGLVPAPSSGDAAAGKFLKADGTWAVAGGSLSDGDKGDITVSASGATWTIDNDVVTYAKMQNVSATSRILGRKTASAGDVEECTLSEVLDFIGSAAQGDILYRGASAWERLAAGTSGYYLKTQGAGANPTWANSGASALPAGYLYGLTLSNNGADATNDIDIATGECRDSTDADDMVLASALTKQLDAAWAVGTNQGGLDTGSIANGTYHVWLIKRSDTGVVDVLFSTSASAPTMPASYDYKRRIGSILRESAAIVPFVQDGDEFMRKTVVLDINATNPGTSAVTRTLSVPVGVRVKAVGTVSGVNAATSSSLIYLSDLSTTDSAPSATVAPLFSARADYDASAALAAQEGNPFAIWTNTSAQIRSRCSASGTGFTLKIATRGWIDRRGKDA